MTSEKLFDTSIYEKSPAVAEWELENQDCDVDDTSYMDWSEYENQQFYAQILDGMTEEEKELLSAIAHLDQHCKTRWSHLDEISAYLDWGELSVLKWGAVLIERKLIKQFGRTFALTLIGEKLILDDYREADLLPEASPDESQSFIPLQDTPRGDGLTAEEMKGYQWDFPLDGINYEAVSEHCPDATFYPPEGCSLTIPKPEPVGDESVSEHGETAPPITPAGAITIYKAGGKGRDRASSPQYYRLSWKEGTRTRHRHIPGGNIKSARAQQRAAKIQQLLSVGYHPAQCARWISSGELAI